MNVFLLHEDFDQSAKHFAALDSRRARKQLLECCQILAAVDILITGETTMLRADGQPYQLTHKNHPCVRQAYHTPKQYMLTVYTALALARQFPTHACAKTIRDSSSFWDRVAPIPDHQIDGQYVVVRRNHPHVYVSTRKDYVSLIRPYLLAKIEKDQTHGR